VSQSLRILLVSPFAEPSRRMDDEPERADGVDGSWA
jgi:hypothetical protein